MVVKGVTQHGDIGLEMTGDQFGDLVVVVLPIVVAAPGPAFVGQRRAGKADPPADPREVLQAGCR